mgnify:CR=1 FL=1
MGVKEAKIYVLKYTDVRGTRLIVDSFESLVDFFLINRVRIPAARRKVLVEKLTRLAAKWGKNL